MLLWDIDEKKQKPQRRPIPAIPETGWRPTAHYPDLSGAKAIAIDTETYDPELTEAGPGWARGKGHIVGFSVATDDGFKGYYPIRHEVQPELNLDPNHSLNWLRDQLKGNQVKVGANLIYDIGWLRQEGITVGGKLLDIQFAEALINPEESRSLEALGQKYLGEGKESTLMYEWLADAYGGKADGKQRANIYRCPVTLAGAYGESDAVLPLQIIQKQWAELTRLDLHKVFDMECRLIQLLVAMRFQGVRVDLAKANVIRDDLLVIQAEHQKVIDEQCGFSVNVNSGPSLVKAFDKFGIEYEVNDKGNPSFTAEFLKGHDHPLAKEVLQVREVTKARSTFIENYILKKNVDGRLYGSFHPLKNDRGGTVSGRFASSDPNLQNIPARTKIGKRIREAFVPDIGHPGWRALDYSSIEYRFLAHYAVGPGAEHVRSVFNNDPFADYHQIVCDMINNATDIGLKRKPAKTINFGLIYGMGEDKLSRALGLSLEEGKNLIKIYFESIPYARETLDHYSNFAGRSGFVETILGRKSYFDKFVPSTRGGRSKLPLPYDEAVAAYGTRIERVGLHKAVNRVLQGSAADLMKMAMVQCYEDGLFDDLMPSLTVHDELDWSDPCEPWSDSQFKEIRHVMQTTIPGISVPIIVATDRGANWGLATEVNYDDLVTPIEE